MSDDVVVDSLNPWPPCAIMRIQFANGSSLRVDAPNGRFFARSKAGLTKRISLGGKGWPNHPLAWEEACAWCDQEPHSEATKALVQQATDVSHLRRPADTVLALQKSIAARRAFQVPNVSVEVGMADRSEDLEALVPCIDVAASAGVSSGCVIEPRYLTLRPRLLEQCTFLNRDGVQETWIKEVEVELIPGVQVLGVLCKLCSLPGWRSGAWHTCCFSTVPKVS